MPTVVPALFLSSLHALCRRRRSVRSLVDRQGLQSFRLIQRTVRNPPALTLTQQRPNPTLVYCNDCQVNRRQSFEVKSGSGTPELIDRSGCLYHKYAGLIHNAYCLTAVCCDTVTISLVLG